MILEILALIDWKFSPHQVTFKWKLSVKKLKHLKNTRTPWKHLKQPEPNSRTSLHLKKAIINLFCCATLPPMMTIQEIWFPSDSPATIFVTFLFLLLTNNFRMLCDLTFFLWALDDVAVWWLKRVNWTFFLHL